MATLKIRKRTAPDSKGKRRKVILLTAGRFRLEGIQSEEVVARNFSERCSLGW